MAVDDIVAQLRSEETRLKQQTEQLRAQFAQAESELTRVQAALVALGEKRATKGGGKPMRARASKREIIGAIADILTQQGVVETHHLKSLVENVLTEQGRTRQGFSARFQESLQDELFVETPGGWRLATEHEQELVSDSGQSRAEDPVRERVPGG